MATASYLAPAPVARRVRGYFAPVNRTSGSSVPAVFDPAEMGRFSLDTPPAPWISLGWLKNFARKSASRSAQILTGIPAATLEQTRETVDAQVSCEFLSWTKLTMALAAGSQHMNLLAPATGAAGAADGAAAVPAVAIQSGATATMLPMAQADAAKFASGQIVVVDVDNTGQTGYVGSPVSGAYVRTALADVDYVRRVSFNLALVASSGATGLTLSEPLPGGAPVVTGTAPMKAQAAVGFVDREGGSFFQEWSGLFVMEGAQGERISYYYPRLQAIGGAAEAGSLLQAKGSTLERVLLSGAWRALPVTDGLDGERVVCYRSFLPAAHAVV
jgi:hypothetical protein